LARLTGPVVHCGFGLVPKVETLQMEVRTRIGEQKFSQAPAALRDGWRMPAKRRVYRDVVKRWLDVAFIIAALPIVLPVMLVLVAILKAGGHSPFFVQERVGQGGQIFKLWKLRTMVPDADARLAEHLEANEAARQEWDAYQKLSVDPRITPFGQFLRKSSLDELPQLWNVLVGDMSLVGPRPMMPDQQDKYPGTAYYVLRPGLTGTWQISDRNASTFAQRADYDADYERSLSFWIDFSILVATVGVVLRATGK
jgi:lipopolysaccharide/colanic/teichoic acid biosynthesis glycosyltransferase